MMIVKHEIISAKETLERHGYFVDECVPAEPGGHLFLLAGRIDPGRVDVMKSTGWRIEEPGWWANDTLGGVCRESDGKWYGYPKIEPETDRIGPFKTAREAVEAIEQSVLVSA